MNKAKKYRISVFLSFTLIFFACEEPIRTTSAGLQGRIYANAGPGWFEYRTVGTIIVSDTNQVKILEQETDSLGTFRIPLDPGIYLLDVKESPDNYQSGPYKVTAGIFVEAKAYYYDARIV